MKQIVESTLRDPSENGSSALVTNFKSYKSAAYYANMYKRDGLASGHVIMLCANPLHQVAALEALHAYPGGLHVGGGINYKNAMKYLDEGASHVVVTSYVSYCSLHHSLAPDLNSGGKKAVPVTVVTEKMGAAVIISA